MNESSDQAHPGAEHPRIRALLFDVGNTLLHPVSAPLEVCRRLLAERGHAPSTDALATAFATADREHLAHYHSLNEDWASARTIEALWLRYYRRVFELLSIADDEAQLAHALIRWYGQPTAWQPFPEVHMVLGKLHARGFVLGAVSDWAPSLPAILHAHGLTRYLQFVLGSGQIGVCKPSRELYQLALRRAGVQAHEAVHIGDSYHGDVRGARSAGIAAILLDRGRSGVRLDCAVIADLRELPPVIAAL